MKHFKSNYLTVLLVACLGLLAAQSVGAAIYAQHTIDNTQAENLLDWLRQRDTNDEPWIQAAIDHIQNLVFCEAEPCPNSYTLLLSPAGETIAMGGATAGGGDDEPVDPPVSPN